MALRGETIGRAYVKILADGTDFGDSVREQLRGDDDAFSQLGRRHSEAYDEGFNEQMDDLSDKIIRGLEAGARRNRGRFDAVGQQVAGDLFDPIDKQFRIAFGDEVAEQMSRDMREAFFRSGGASDTVDDFIEHLEANWEKATRKVDDLHTAQIESMLKEQQRYLEEEERGRKESVKGESDASQERLKIRREEFKAQIAFLKARIEKTVEAEKIEEDAAKVRAKIEKESQAELRKTQAEFRTLVRQIKAFHNSLDADRQGRKEFQDDLERVGERIRTLGGDTRSFERDFRNVRTELNRTHPVLSRLTNQFNKFGDGIGRAFGKGSRNDFLNFFGRLVGAFSSIPSLLTRSLQGLSNFVGSFITAFGDGGLFGVFKKFSVTVAGAAIALGTLAAVMGGVVLIAGVLSSAILGLAGALSAMVGSLVFAATGGIAVLAGALVPLVAGIGVATLAIMNMDKETKKAFDGIGKSFKDLGKDAAQTIFDTPKKDAAAFKEAIEGLQVITGPVSRALGGLLDEFIDSLDDPRIKRFQTFLATSLPEMVTSLGHIFGNIGTAFQGIFIAIEPFVQEFLGMIEDLTGRFSDWANSGKGRTSIEDFMERAKDSAEAVGDAIGSLTDLVTTFLTAGQTTGDDLFTSLARTFDDWIGRIEKAQEDGTLQKWFDDAKETARQIGDAIVAIGELAGALDTEENRQALSDLLEGFKDLVDFVKTISPILEGVFNSVVGPILNAIEAIRKIKKAWQEIGAIFVSIYNAAIGPALANLISAISHVMRGLGNLFGALASIPGAPDWIGKTAKGLIAAADEADGLANSVRNIPTTHDTNYTVTANQAAINKVEAQLNNVARPRTATVTVTVRNTQGGEAPGGGVGGADGDPTTPQRSLVPAARSVVNITMNTPTFDPKALTAELMNRLAAAAYT